MPIVQAPFAIVAVIHDARAAQAASPSSAPPSSAPPADSVAGNNSSSSVPDDAAAPAHARRHRARRRHRAAERVAPPVRRRRRSRRNERRGPAVVISTRYINIATDGSPGPTWTARFAGLPLAGARGAARMVRFAVGAELAFRAAPFDRTDPIVWALFDVGFQYPTRYATPFVTGVLAAGVGERFRFDRPAFEFAYQLGVEGGIDLRPSRWHAGLELAAGVGRTAIGEQWSINGWVRFGLAFF